MPLRQFFFILFSDTLISVNCLDFDLKLFYVIPHFSETCTNEKIRVCVDNDMPGSSSTREESTNDGTLFVH